MIGDIIVILFFIIAFICNVFSPNPSWVGAIWIFLMIVFSVYGVYKTIQNKKQWMKRYKKFKILLKTQKYEELPDELKKWFKKEYEDYRLTKGVYSDQKIKQKFDKLIMKIPIYSEVQSIKLDNETLTKIWNFVDEKIKIISSDKEDNEHKEEILDNKNKEEILDNEHKEDMVDTEEMVDKEEI